MQMQEVNTSRNKDAEIICMVLGHLWDKFATESKMFTKSVNKISLRWDGFQESAGNAFISLRGTEDFADVTLACENGPFLEAHKIILASSSPFFKDILGRTHHPHPLIFLRGVKSFHLTSLLDFVYQGEAEVEEKNLEAFLALGQELGLPGLGLKKEVQELDLGYSPGSGSSRRQENSKRAEMWKFEDSEFDGYRRNTPEAVSEIKAPVLSNDIMMTLNLDDSGEPIPKLSEKVQDFTDKTKSNSKIDISDSKVQMDVRELDDQINTLMSKSKEESQGKAWKCKVCGKEGIRDAIKKHIEAHHINGVVHFCEICGKASKSRNALSVHKSTNHRKMSV